MRRLFIPAAALLLLLSGTAYAQPAGGDDPEVERLNRDYVAAYGRGDFPEALRLAQQALAGAQTRLGPADPAIPVLTGNVATALARLGRYPEAESLLAHTLRDQERIAGREHRRTLILVNNLAALYMLMGRYADAEPLFQRALAAQERTLGRDHADTLQSVGNLGTLYLQQGRYAAAEPLILRARDSYRRTLGPDDLTTLRTINNLAELYRYQGRYGDAEPLYRQAIETGEHTLGAEHPETLQFLANLGTLYLDQGKLREAETLFVRVLASNERRQGRDHPATLLAAHNLAQVYTNQGRAAEAEPLHLRVLEGDERTLGRDHPDTLLAVNSLAQLYADQGRAVEAEALYQRALETAERVLGRDHPRTLLFVDSLGRLYASQGRGGEAEPLFRRGLETRERILGRDHPDTLASAAGLAALYRSTGRPADAERLYLRVTRSAPRRLGRDYPDAIVAAANLGELYFSQRRYRDAESRLATAIEAERRVLGADHPNTITSAATLARLRIIAPRRGADPLEPARQVASALRARRTQAGDDNYAASQSARERSGLGELFALTADAAWLPAQASPRDRAALTAEAFVALQDSAAGPTDRAVARMAVRHLADQTGAGLAALVRERQDLDDRWAANNRRYGLVLADPVASEDGAALRRQLLAERTGIEARMAQIDLRLRQDFPQYFALTRSEATDVASAQALLAPDEAILMVVPTEFGTHVIAVSRTDISWVRAPWTRDQVNRAVLRLLWDVGANVRVDPAQAAEWERQGGAGYPYDRGTAFALYQQVVAPVASLLEGKRHVFVAASGSLGSLPFGILVTAPPEGADGDPQALRATHWFADAHALTVIPSIQSLQFLRRQPAAPRAGTNRGFIGFGDPLLQGTPAQRASGRGLRSGGAVIDVRQLRRLNRLPGTAAELESMRRTLGAPARSLFLGRRATEARLRGMDLSRANILALATHGLIAGELAGTTEPGLVLTPPEQASETDDGYLTASEVTTLRLNADWVILSACNTAAGDGSSGAPGLSGLARAFFYAGARNLLASHWPVRDDIAARLTVRTIALMREIPGLSRAEALQRAMREARNDASHDRPDDSWAHPSAWAPFVLIGDGAN